MGLLNVSLPWGWLVAFTGPNNLSPARYQENVPAATHAVTEVALLPSVNGSFTTGDSQWELPDKHSQLVVQNSPSGKSAYSAFRFNLSGPPAQISSAKLVLYPTSVQSTRILVNQAAVVPNELWNDNPSYLFTRKNPPAILGSWSPIDGELVQVDVTPEVQTAILTGGELSLAVFAPPDIDLTGRVTYGARESPAEIRPRLIINTVQQIYPDEPGFKAWNSLHWSNGTARPVTRSGDPSDPSGWSQFRGIGSIQVDGNGILTMRGDEPRIYINGLPEQIFNNVEVTVYYKRVSDDGTPWSGAVIGVRSGPNGHTELSPCTSTTYYARLRHDGDIDFFKELRFPQGEARGRTQGWDGGILPYQKWIGIKFVVYNLDENAAVKLELYRDLTGGVRGGRWEKLAEYIDTGGWGKAEGCPYPSDHVITEGGGTVFIRNSGVAEAQYKGFSVREIHPPGE